MIEPIFQLLQQLALGQRTGMLLLVTTASGAVSHLVTLWLREGQMVHVSGRMRQGAAALLLLHHARQLRRWQWFDLAPPADLQTQHLPEMQAFLDYEERHVIPIPLPDRSVTLEQARMERLFSIRRFLHTMGGPAGDDTFMQILFAHPPSQAWDELVEAYREHISVYFGGPVARQVVDA